jgi:cysteinyl-tRNA synthetase
MRHPWALSRLRAAYAACPSGGEPDTALVDAFNQDLNEDLNLPRALAETWNVIRRDRNPSSKVATLNVFDEVLGLRLNEWRPAEVEVGVEIRELAAARDRARRERRWSEADRLRAENQRSWLHSR